MTGEEFKRISVLTTMRAHLITLRPKLVALEIKDFFHLEHAERLVTELLAEPAHEQFHEMAQSLYWHIQFCFAEYQKYLLEHELTDESINAEFFGEEGAA